jgi:isocitrate dehydrogenase kinase/phosphatase
VIFRRRRGRFGELIDRQLDLFETDHADVIAEARAKLDRYNAADRDEAEELYGDYVGAVETGTEILADIRDHFARTLDDDASEQFEREFNAAVGKRLPQFALEIENR